MTIIESSAMKSNGHPTSLTLGRISLHRRGAPSRRRLAGPRSAQSHGNAAWRGVGRWGASRATMRAARRFAEKRSECWNFFTISPRFFVYHCWGRVDMPRLISFLGIESTYITIGRSSTKKTRLKTGGPGGQVTFSQDAIGVTFSQDAIGGPGFLANLSPCKQYRFKQLPSRELTYPPKMGILKMIFPTSLSVGYVKSPWRVPNPQKWWMFAMTKCHCDERWAWHFGPLLERFSDGRAALWIAGTGHHPSLDAQAAWKFAPTWRIIPFSKWLITMVSKSPK